jgi:hypothetical protein
MKDYFNKKGVRVGVLILVWILLIQLHSLGLHLMNQADTFIFNVGLIFSLLTLGGIFLTIYHLILTLIKK